MKSGSLIVEKFNVFILLYNSYQSVEKGGLF